MKVLNTNYGKLNADGSTGECPFTMRVEVVDQYHRVIDTFHMPRAQAVLTEMLDRYEQDNDFIGWVVIHLSIFDTGIIMGTTPPVIVEFGSARTEDKCQD